MTGENETTPPAPPVHVPIDPATIPLGEVLLAEWIHQKNADNLPYGVDPEHVTGEEIKALMLAGFKVNSAEIGSDDTALEILLSFMAGREITGDGLHSKVSGDRGAGKSVVINAALNCLPQGIIYAGAFTPRALVYDKTLTSGIIVKVDESQELTPEFLSVMKESISSFQTPIKYRTILDKKDGTVIKIIPERITWVIVSCDNVGEEQVLDRMFPMGIDSKDKYQNITTFRLTRRKVGREKLAVNDDVMKIRYALTHYTNKLFRVLIPFSDRIRYKPSVKRDQRLQEFFENCIIYHAVLCYRERYHEEHDGLITVHATEVDFTEVAKIGIFNKPMQITKRLSPSEVQLIKDIVAKGYHRSGYPTPRSDILNLGYSQPRLSNILTGRNKEDNGLLSKVPGMAETQINVGGKDTDHRSSELAYIIPFDIAAFIPENEGIEGQAQAIAALDPVVIPGSPSCEAEAAGDGQSE